MMENMNYPVEKIKDMCSWRFFQGFTGDICGTCKKKGNVLAGAPGYMCPSCGSFNVLSCIGIRVPFDSPDFGPPQARIQEGYEMYRAGKDVMG